MAREWGKKLAGSREYTCTRCGSIFSASGPGRHRICGGCKSKNEKPPVKERALVFSTNNQGPFDPSLEIAAIPSQQDVDEYRRVDSPIDEVVERLEKQEVVYAHRVDHCPGGPFSDQLARVEYALENGLHVKPEKQWNWAVKAARQIRHK